MGYRCKSNRNPLSASPKLTPTALTSPAIVSKPSPAPPAFSLSTAPTPSSSTASNGASADSKSYLYSFYLFFSPFYIPLFFYDLSDILFIREKWKT
jgi:hypothetical protein